MNQMRIVGLGIALIAIFVAIFYLEKAKPDRIDENSSKEITNISLNKSFKAGRYETAKEIASPHGFINAEDFTISEFIGKKVILVDFWTYSCINCQRTTPYLNAWWDKYKDKGLIIIGVHTPEFEFEKKYENVSNATAHLNIEYPVVLDNDYATWSAYKNRYWPRKYLIDIDGFIVYDHIGEGAYAETEKKIQELLEERVQTLGMQDGIEKDIAKPQEAESADLFLRRSPEIYFGASRNDNLENGKGGIAGPQTFPPPQTIKTNSLYLAGDWNIENEYAENKSKTAKIIFRYQAKKVFFVAGSDTPVPIRVLRDGKPLSNEVGEDITDTANSATTISEHRLYRLIEDTEYGEHTLEIIIENPGLKAFTFTFG